MRFRYSVIFSASMLSVAILAACGGGTSGSGTNDTTATPNTSSTTGSSSSSSSAGTSVYSSSVCPGITLSATNAQTLTGDSTPITQISLYGVRSYSAPVLINGLHDPSNYLAAPVLPTWQFATTDPTNGTLSSLECDVGQDVGWHNYHRTSGTSSTITHGKVIVTGGRNATASHIYTVYNGQQLVAAINDAGLAPKIIRVVGHIDLRWSSNNTVFREYTSYLDQKFGGSIGIPSNTTLVGINDANGNPARITGTTILVGAELGTTTSVMASATGDPETDFKKWIALGYDGDSYPTWTRNIIIRNLKIDTPWDVNPEDSGNAYADGITISRTQNIWIDHVTISDGDTPDSIITDSSTRHDGALDIVRGSDYVTISNSFIGDHGKTTLVGNGDSGRAWSDQNRLHVTLTGMWWYGTASRLPLIRFGQLHSFNNLIEGTSNTPTYGHKFAAGIDVRYSSSVLAENNFHLFTGLKIPELCGKIIGSTSGSEFRTSGNYFISDKYNSKDWSLAWSGPVNVDSVLIASTCTEMPTTDVSWAPPYSYTPVCAAQARRNVEASSGAGRIGMYATTGASTDTLSSTSCYDSNVYSFSSSSTSSASSASSVSSSSSAASSAASSSSASSSSASTSSGSATLALAYANESFGGSTATVSGSIVSSGTTSTLTSIGGKMEGAKDGYSLAAQDITGNFTLTASLNSIGTALAISSTQQYRVGLMMCDCANGTITSAPIYASLGLGATATSSVYYPYYASRATTGASIAKSTFSATDTQPASTLIFVLARNGLTVTLSYSTDGGSSFTAKTTTFTALPDTLKVGIFGASGVATTGSAITFSNISITQ